MKIDSRFAVKLYRDNRTQKVYVLEEHVTMGSKVCLVPLDKGEDKFLSPNTLKRHFTFWGEELMVEVKAFTGMKIGVFKVAYYDKDTIQVWTKGDKLMIFDRNPDFRQNDKQSNAKNSKYANQIGRHFGFFHPWWIDKKEA